MKYSINKSGQLVIEIREPAKCIKRYKFDDGGKIVLFQAKCQRKNHFLVSYLYPDGEAQHWNHFEKRGEAEAAFANLEATHRKMREEAS